MLAFDLETELIDRAYLAPAPVSWSMFADNDNAATLGLCSAPGFWARLVGILRSNVRLLGANVAYDMAVLMEHAPTIERRNEIAVLIFEKYGRGEIWDISVNQKIIDYAVRGHKRNEGYSLGLVATYHGLEHANKNTSWRTRFVELRNIDPENWPAGARSYVLDDARLPLEITHRHLKLEEQWKAKTGTPLFTHLAGEEASKAFALHLVSCWGVRTDPTRSKAFVEKVLARLEKGRETLIAAGLVRPDGSRDTKRAAAAMVAACQELGLPVPRTDKGGVCLDKEACEASGSDLLVAYSDYVQATTLRARAYDILEGTTLPLQARFNSLLETSRTSTSKPDPPLVGAQMQNFPRELGARECLEPRPGYVFIGGDLPTAELRSLSQLNYELFGFTDMGDQINAGMDLHTWFGAKIIGLSYEEALARAEEDLVKNARQYAKPCNFGFPGGMGIANFRAFAWSTYKVRLSAERAEELRAMWLASFREMKLYFERAGKLVKTGREFKREDGSGTYKAALMQHMRTGRWRNRVPYCTFCNSGFQERTATGAARGLIEVARRQYSVKSSDLYGTRTVLYTHDEIVAECREEQAHEAAMELGSVMAERFNTLHPDVPVKDVAPFVARIYSKKTKPVFGPDGRLIPWVPKAA